MRPAGLSLSSDPGDFNSGPVDPISPVTVTLSKRFKTDIELSSSAIGQVGEEASAATGQAAAASSLEAG